MKPLSGIRANSHIVIRKDLEELNPLRGPIHLQKYIKGDDIRAHVVGNIFMQN